MSLSCVRKPARAVVWAATVLLGPAPIAAQSVVFTAPAAGTTCQVGSFQDIRWRWSGQTEQMARTPVQLLYRLLPNGPWREIGQTEAFRQSYRWRVPPEAVGQVALRAVWRGRVPMTFAGPEINISTPNAGRSLAAGGRLERVTSPRASDYSLRDVSFQDGRPLSDGIMYDPDTRNDARLNVFLEWNQVDTGYGTRCEGHRISVTDDRGVMVNPLHEHVPAPDAGGRITVPVLTHIGTGLTPGSEYSFLVRFVPYDAACDAIAANNQRRFTTRLIRMVGNDLVVRIVSARKVAASARAGMPCEALACEGLKIVYEVMNVSGTEPLANVQIGFGFQGSDRTYSTTGPENVRVQPGVWNRRTVYFNRDFLESHWGLRVRYGNMYRLIVTVDPGNQAVELREDNNQADLTFIYQRM